jgi:hypothetical protein
MMEEGGFLLPRRTSLNPEKKIEKIEKWKKN